MRSLSLQRLVDTSLFRSQKTVRSTTGLKGRLKAGLIFCNKPQTPRYFANLAVKWTFFCHFHRHFFNLSKKNRLFFQIFHKNSPLFSL